MWWSVWTLWRVGGGRIWAEMSETQSVQCQMKQQRRSVDRIQMFSATVSVLTRCFHDAKEIHLLNVVQVFDSKTTWRLSDTTSHRHCYKTILTSLPPPSLTSWGVRSGCRCWSCVRLLIWSLPTWTTGPLELRLTRWRLTAGTSSNRWPEGRGVCLRGWGQNMGQS